MNEQERLNALAAPLLTWYDIHKRVLPWRGIRDPYRIWVSEIMLQQTRVQAVLEYYARFMAELPDVYALAAEGENNEFLWADGAALQAAAIPSAFRYYFDTAVRWLAAQQGGTDHGTALL